MNVRILLIATMVFYGPSFSIEGAKPKVVVVETESSEYTDVLANTLVKLTLPIDLPSKGATYKIEKLTLKLTYITAHNKRECIYKQDNDQGISEIKLVAMCPFASKEFTREEIEQTDKQIRFNMPADLWEERGTRASLSGEVQFTVNGNSLKEKFSGDIAIAQNETIVTTAIRLRKSGMSEPEISEHLHNQGRQLIEDHYRLQRIKSIYCPLLILDNNLCFDKDWLDDISRKTFGNYHLSRDGSDAIRLKKAGMEPDFIAKMSGQPQYVTIGAGFIWMVESQNYVVAPMLRIFVSPVGFYTPRKPLEILHLWSTWDWRRVGLNLGYASSAATGRMNSGTNKELKNYVLFGFSFEINRYAMLNIGMGIVPGGSDQGNTQFYLGLTLDQNMLKGLGLIKD